VMLEAAAVTQAATEVSYVVTLASYLTIHTIPTVPVDIETLRSKQLAGLFNCCDHD
jgi:hypothetical protein